MTTGKLAFTMSYTFLTSPSDTFGFAQVGANASIALGEPGRLGPWTLNAGVSVLFLGDQASDYNAGDEVEVIVSVGVQWNF